MSHGKLNHVNRRLTDEERARHAQVAAAALRDFPPKAATSPSAPSGIATRIRAARQSQGLTWYALAKLAGIDQAAIRDIEQGRAVTISDLEAAAAALGLRLELVATSA